MFIVEKNATKKYRRRIIYAIISVLVCSTILFINYRSKHRSTHIVSIKRQAPHKKNTHYNNIRDYMRTIYTDNENNNNIHKSTKIAPAVNGSINAMLSPQEQTSAVHAQSVEALTQTQQLYDKAQYTLMSLPSPDRALIQDIQYNSMDIQQILHNVHTIEHAIHEECDLTQETLQTLFRNTDYALRTKLDTYTADRRITNNNMHTALTHSMYCLENELLLNGTVQAVVSVFMSMLQQNITHRSQVHNLPHLIHSVMQCLQRINIVYREHVLLSRNFHVIYAHNITLTQQAVHLRFNGAWQIWLPSCTVEHKRTLVLHDDYNYTQDADNIHTLHYPQDAIVLAQTIVLDNDDATQIQSISYTASHIIACYIKTVCAHERQILPNILLVLGEANYRLHAPAPVTQLHNVQLAEIEAATITQKHCVNICAHFGRATPLEVLALTIGDYSRQYEYKLQHIYDTTLDRGSTVMIKLSNSSNNVAIMSSTTGEMCDSSYDTLYNIPIGSLLFKQCAEVMACIIHDMAHNICNNKYTPYHIEVFMEAQNTIIYGSSALPISLLAHALQITINTIQYLCSTDTTFTENIMRTYTDNLDDMQIITDRFITCMQELQVTVFSFTKTKLLHYALPMKNERTQQIYNMRLQYNNELLNYNSLCNLLQNTQYIKDSLSWNKYVLYIVHSNRHYSARNKICIQNALHNINVITNITLQQAKQLYIQAANKLYKQQPHNMPKGFVEARILENIVIQNNEEENARATVSNTDVTAVAQHNSVKLAHEKLNDGRQFKYIEHEKVWTLRDKEMLKQYMKQHKIQLSQEHYEHFLMAVEQAEQIEKYIVAMQHMNKIRTHFVV